MAVNEFTCLAGLGPKGVDRMGDEDADAYDDQACHRGLKQHRGGFRLVAREWAVLDRQTLLALGRSDGTSMEAPLQIRKNCQWPLSAQTVLRVVFMNFRCRGQSGH